MPVNTLDHFLVLTDDLDRTRDFYCNILGLEEGFRPDIGFPGYWLYLGKTACVHIAEWETYPRHSIQRGLPVSSPAPGTGAADHIAFHGNDADDILQRLQQHDIAYGRNDVPEAGLLQLFVTDPNGVKVELNFSR